MAYSRNARKEVKNSKPLSDPQGKDEYWGDNYINNDNIRLSGFE
jgi:hypothetical protein